MKYFMFCILSEVSMCTQKNCLSETNLCNTYIMKIHTLLSCLSGALIYIILFIFHVFAYVYYYV